MRPKFPPTSRDRRNRPATPLTDQQIFRASTLWEENHSLGEIAEEVGCSVYQLGFLYRELLPHVRRVDITPLVEGQQPTPVKHKKPDFKPYAIGFRDHKGIRDGFDAGPFPTLKEALDYIPDESNIIVRLTDPLQVVAVWDSEHTCWVVTGKKTKRA